MTGSDIREFGKPLAPPELPAIIAAIEASRKPFVAAITGAALGGGYELALGCDRRVAAADAVVGLPEVTLGMIPGAGGTQRLPRLVGLIRAAELICRSSRVPAPQALAEGMIEEVAEGDPRSAAIAAVRAMKGRKHRVADRVLPAWNGAEFDAVAESLLKMGRRRPAVIDAIDSLRDAAALDVTEALRRERERFTELRLGPDAAALRYLFFAERAARRGPFGVKPGMVDHVGVVGAGTMGAGIAAALLAGGFRVTLVDSSHEAMERAQDLIEKALHHWQHTGRMTARQRETARDMLARTGHLDDLSSCDLVIEAIAEDMSAKLGLFNSITSIVRPQTIIASNTSYLDLEAMATVVTRSERFLGLHFFNPPHIMRLLEVITTSRTDDETLSTALSVARRLDKIGVVANVGPGFIGNRIYAAYRHQCEIMLEDGAWPEQVDEALEAFGFALGPFATGDLSGLDIAWAMRKAQAVTRDPAMRYVSIPDRLCEAGRLGRKTGAGYYRYESANTRRQPDPEVRAIIEEESAAKNISRRIFDDSEIIDRVMGSIIISAARLLEEGVARNAGDIDVVMVHGYGFPRHLGGPLWWAAYQPRARIDAAMRCAARATGAGFRQGDVEAMLDRIAQGYPSAS